MEERELIPPIQPKEKKRVPWWKKLMVIVPILFLSTWALAMWNPLENEEASDNVFEISGYTFFEMQDNTFGTYVVSGETKIPVAFRLDPRNASKYYLEDGVIDTILKSGKIYISFNPNVKDYSKLVIASVEISRITGLYGIPTTGAYSEDKEPVDPNTPVKNCNDATDTTTVIIVETGNKNEVIAHGNCIKVIGTDADEAILIADKLGLNLLGINI